MRIPGNPAGRELLRCWNEGEIQKSPFSPFFPPPQYFPLALGSPGAGKRDFPVVDPNKLILGENIGKMVLGRGCCEIRRGMGIAFPKFPFFGAGGGVGFLHVENSLCSRGFGVVFPGFGSG